MPQDQDRGKGEGDQRMEDMMRPDWIRNLDDQVGDVQRFGTEFFQATVRYQLYELYNPIRPFVASAQILVFLVASIILYEMATFYAGYNGIKPIVVLEDVFFQDIIKMNLILIVLFVVHSCVLWYRTFRFFILSFVSFWRYRTLIRTHPQRCYAIYMAEYNKALQSMRARVWNDLFKI